MLIPNVVLKPLTKKQSGKFFDPEVVEAFLAIYDVIKAIRDKYPDERTNFSPATSF